MTFMEKFRYPILFGGMLLFTYFGTKQYPQLFKKEIEDHKIRAAPKMEEKDEQALKKLEEMKWTGIKK